MKKSSEIYYELMIARSKERRQKRRERDTRRIEMGYLPGWKMRPCGMAYYHGPKGIQNWYSTKELVERVQAAFDRSENITGIRRCRINGRHLLQIRGKHLRRLLKAMPNVYQSGRYLYERTEDGQKA